MASGVEESDDPMPIALQNPPPEQISVEKFRQILAERDEALKLNERVSAELAEANRHKNEISDQFDEIVKENDGLRSEIGKFRDLALKVESQRPLVVDQLGFISKIHRQVYDIVKIVDSSGAEDFEFCESLFLPRERDMEENLHASLAGMEFVYSLAKLGTGKIRGLIEEKICEIRDLNETVAKLLKEKDDIGVIYDPSSKENQLFDAEEDERAGALENIVKTSQSEIIELRHSPEEPRAESVVLKENLESQSKKLKLRSLQIEELEEEKRVANESVEGLMMDIAAAKEEIMRWKVAAEQEAAAGKTVEQEFLAQISAVKQELEEARQVILDSDKKLKFKEKIANAAMAARDAAEKSLSLADVRASWLKERLFDLTRQLEQLDRKDSRNGGLNGHRYVCWPWQWLGLDFVGSCHSETQQESSNKMELSEPLL